jgi:hypothetical protein
MYLVNLIICVKLYFYPWDKFHLILVRKKKKPPPSKALCPSARLLYPVVNKEVEQWFSGKGMTS